MEAKSQRVYAEGFVNAEGYSNGNGKLKEFFKKPAVQMLMGNPIKARKDKKKAEQQAKDAASTADLSSAVVDDASPTSTSANTSLDAPAPPVGLANKFKALSTPKKVALIALPILAIGVTIFLIRRKK